MSDEEYEYVCRRSDMGPWLNTPALTIERRSYPAATCSCNLPDRRARKRLGLKPGAIARCLHARWEFRDAPIPRKARTLWANTQQKWVRIEDATAEEQRQ